MEGATLAILRGNVATALIDEETLASRFQIFRSIGERKREISVGKLEVRGACCVGERSSTLRKVPSMSIMSVTSLEVI